MKTEAGSSEKKTKIKRESDVTNSRQKKRDIYLLERERIKQEIGDLDEIREKLGMSQRRACQLLLVDPSAWTRWNKTEAPPHVYQALRWLLELKKVNPEAAGPVDLTKRIEMIETNTLAKLREFERNLSLVERTVALPSNGTALTPRFGEISEVLRSQEERFQNKISELERRIEELKAREAEVLLGGRDKAAKKRKIKPRAKRSAGTGARARKKRQPPQSRKSARKTAIRKRSRANRKPRRRSK